MINKTRTTTPSNTPEPTVRVPLAKGAGTAELYLDDYLKLKDAGLGGPWFFSHNGAGTKYVRCHRDGDRLASISRLIVGAGPGQIVRHRDGDRLNLRKSNLSLHRGPAKHDEDLDGLDW